MKLIIVLGSTRTATIPGITAAGETPELVFHTPAADAEIVQYGAPVHSPGVPISPSGCPTPALVTRAVRDLIPLDVDFIGAGLATPCAAPLVDVSSTPGRDIREEIAVPDAERIVSTTITIGRALPDDQIFIGESIPGGTTSALGVLRALGEPYVVSSSLETNPITLKEETVTTGLDASDLAPGTGETTPVAAITKMGDPVLAGIFGIVKGALETNTSVILCGGTQMIAVSALLRHDSIMSPLTIATTSYLATDSSSNIRRAADDLGLTLLITDPSFDPTANDVFAQYESGLVKEGVAMGGALWLADLHGISIDTLHTQIMTRYRALQDTNEA